MSHIVRTPKIIHHIIGQKTTPVINKCLKSWLELEDHGFEIMVWNDEVIAEFLQSQHSFAYGAFLNARNHAEAADIARYLIIYTYGGYYIDWDIELLDTLKFLRLSDQFPTGYMLVDPANGTLASEYFCSIANDPFLYNLVVDIVSLYSENMRDLYPTPQYSGPFRMRDSLLVHRTTHMQVVPVKEVFAYDYSEIRNPPQRKITQAMIHYWAHSWIKNVSV